jgi:hypothetical protein
MQMSRIPYVLDGRDMVQENNESYAELRALAIKENRREHRWR